MKTYTFTFKIEDPHGRSYDELEEIIAKDYDDALFGSSDDEFELDFEIEAGSMEKAIKKALRYISPLDVIVKRVTPDSYVTQSEIARRIHISKQGVQKMINSKSDFPSPNFHIRGSSVWAWPRVAKWCCDNGKLSPDDVKEAKDVYSFNRDFEDVLS